MTDIIQQHFGLEQSRSTEEELRAWLIKRIAYMLDHETDLLMSTLYRLDVEESKILRVLELSDQSSIPAGLADLVLERQRLRQETKQNYRVDRDHFYWGEEE